MNREIIIDRIITLSKKLNKTPRKREYAKEYNNTEFSRYFKGAYVDIKRYTNYSAAAVSERVINVNKLSIYILYYHS